MADKPQVTKRKVTMTTAVAVADPKTGEVRTELHQVEDFIRPDFLEEYVADARSRWQLVQVSTEPDAGPAGYHGATHIPGHLDHPLAGQTFPATTPGKG